MSPLARTFTLMIFLTAPAVWGQARPAGPQPTRFHDPAVQRTLQDLQLKGALKSLRGGVDGGGGGEFLPDEVPTPAEVVASVTEARILVPFVLSHLEGIVTLARASGSSKNFGREATGYFSLSRATYDLLFPWPQQKVDVFARIPDFNFHIVDDAPCFDAFNDPKAASAFLFETPDICVSIPEIQQNATRANLRRRMVALLTHEISHKMGIVDEAEALRIEALVNEGIPADPKPVLLAAANSILGATDPDRGWMMVEAKAALKALKQEPVDWGAVCFAIAEIDSYGETFGEHQKAETKWIEVLRAELQGEEAAIRSRSWTLRPYCVDETFTQKNVQKIFPIGKTEVPLNASGDGLLSIVSGTWRRPEKHNRERLTAELQDILVSINKISFGAKQAVKLLGGDTRAILLPKN